MKSPNPAVILVLALAAGGAAGAWTASLGNRDAEPSSGVAAPVEPGGELDPLERVAALEEENRRLRERVEALENRPLPAARTPAETGGDYLSRAEFEAWRETLEQTPVTARSTPLGEPEDVKAQLVEALEAVRKEERVAAVRENQEKWLGRLDVTMPKLEERLGLDRDQSLRLRSALLAKFDRDQELIRMWEEGVDYEVLGERKAADADLLRADLTSFLSEDQVAELRTFSRQLNGK